MMMNDDKTLRGSGHLLGEVAMFHTRTTKQNEPQCFTRDLLRETLFLRHRCSEVAMATRALTDTSINF